MAKKQQKSNLEMKLSNYFIIYLFYIIITIILNDIYLGLFNVRVEYHEKENTQYKNEQHHQHVTDESNGHQLNHAHPKLDLKNFHTQLW